MKQGQIANNSYGYAMPFTGDVFDSGKTHRLRRSWQVVAGGLHTCAILWENVTKCWGWGYYGQLGNGNSTNIGDDANEILGDGCPRYLTKDGIKTGTGFPFGLQGHASPMNRIQWYGLCQRQLKDVERLFKYF